jgi:hypothetical protein
MTARLSSRPIRRAVSSSDRGASDSVVAFGLPPPQPGRRLSSSGRRSEDEQRDAARPLDEVLDEIEEAVVGSVEVLEHEHGGAPVAERLEETAPGGEALVAPGLARAVPTESDERP